MTKPRVVPVHPATELFPRDPGPPALDGLDVEPVTVECRTRDEAIAAVRGAGVVMIGGFRVDAELIGAMDRAQDDPLDPLLRMDDVIATPPADGESTESAAVSARVASRQAAAPLRGERPDRVVNPAVYGRLRAAGPRAARATPSDRGGAA